MKRTIKWMLTGLLAACMLTGCGSKSLEEGVSLLESGKYEAAAGKFKEAADEDRNAGEAYRGLGIAEWEQGQYEAALNAFENALDNGAEKTAEIYNLMGCCELKLSEPKAALDYFHLGMECEDVGDELMQEMKYNEIVAYEDSGQWENARTKLKKYCKAYPDDERASKEAEFLETQQQD